VVTNKSYRAPQLNMRRSKISPSKFSNTKVNPYTGEYLSAGERKLLFQKRIVSSANVFKKLGALVRTPSKIIPSKNVFKKSEALINPKTSSIASDNKPKDKNDIKSLEKRFSGLEKGFSGLEKNVYSISKASDNKSDNKILSKRVFVLENDVSFLAKTLNKEAELEKKAQKQYEKDVEKVEEKKLRSGEEKKLEKKITKGLISPVKAVGKKAGGVLGTLMELFMTLLGGWLTNQGLEAIKANAEGNIDKLEEIKKNVTETLATVGGIFALLSGGLLVIGAIVKSLAKRIAKFLWRKTFGRILNPKPPKTTPKPTNQKPNPTGTIKPSTPTPKSGSLKGGGSAQAPRAGAGNSGLLDRYGKPLKSSPLDAYRGSGSSPARAPKIPQPKPVISKTPKFKGFKGMRGGIAGIALGLGLSLFETQIVDTLGSFYGKFGVGFRSMKDSEILSEMDSLEKKVISLDIENKPWNGIIAESLINESSIYFREAKRRELIKVSEDGSEFLYTEKGIKAKNPNKSARDSLSAEDKKVTPGTLPPSAAVTPTPAVTTPVPGEMPAAQISSSPSSMPSAPGPVSGGGNTTVIYKKVGGAGRGAGDQSLKSGSATDVPLIASANPSNFYTMYSQIVYNVVN